MSLSITPERFLDAMSTDIVTDRDFLTRVEALICTEDGYHRALRDAYEVAISASIVSFAAIARLSKVTNVPIGEVVIDLRADLLPSLGLDRL